MTSREWTIAFELAIGLFALYLLARRIGRMMRAEVNAPAFHVQDPTDEALANPEGPVTIAWFQRGEEAEMWAATLREAGIDATVRDVTFGGTPSSGLTNWVSPKLDVRAEDARRAVEILREAEQGRNPIEGEGPADGSA
jgi:hypothetical protein